MKINQVEELVDITKKNIRFYEEQGLLNPDRDPENGYREYSLKDVEALKKIKLFRKLSVPIEEIKKIEAGTLSINECMEDRIRFLSEEQQNMEVMKNLCNTIREEIADISLLDASDYLERMKNMEKKGTIFMDIEREDVMKKSRNGALIATIAAVIVITALTIGIGVMSFLDGAPLWLLLVNIVVGILLDIGIIVCMAKRLKEIKGGEEYEARKY